MKKHKKLQRTMLRSHTQKEVMLKLVSWGIDCSPSCSTIFLNAITFKTIQFCLDLSLPWLFDSSCLGSLVSSMCLYGRESLLGKSCLGDAYYPFFGIQSGICQSMTPPATDLKHFPCKHLLFCQKLI